MSELDVTEEEIPQALDGQRVDRVVSLITGLSRSRAAIAVESGRVTINAKVVVKPSLRVATGDRLVVETTREGDRLEPDSTVEISVVYDDAHVIVVNKQAGLVVHPGAGTEAATLVHGLLARYPELGELRDLDDPPDRPGIVHRLDRGTSGLLVVARTAAAKESLARQLKQRTVSRQYLTLLSGHLEADSGVIDAPLGRSPRNPTIRSVVADGKPARTHYEVLERYTKPDLTLAGVRLETGRTHQIRAHFAAVGHLVTGDRQYGDEDALGLGRPFLHAGQLGFAHPENGEWRNFDAPLPPELREPLDRLVASAD